MIPIPKSSPPSVDKLRPISLTNHFAKVAEGFIARWLLEDIGPRLDPAQFGNRKHFSTNHYLINMLHLLYRNANKSRTVATVTTSDFSKAFDRINHTLVLNKLIHFEVRPSIIPWIADFLTSREQCVRYNSICSTWLTLNAGVPQGTKLGPILFLVMINDVRPTGDNLAVFKYVDDLSIVECRPFSQKSCLQDAIDNLTNWSMQNNMKLNPSKCFQMNVDFSRNSPVMPIVSIDDHDLCITAHIKVLGVIIQNDLKWDKNVDSSVKRANTKVHMLRVHRSYGLPHSDLITLYKSFIRPLMEYAAPVWNGALTQHQVTRLERVQKRALRIILGAEYLSYTQALSHFNLDSLAIRRDQISSSFFKKTLDHTDLFREFFPPQHTRMLRNKPAIPEICCRTKRYSTSALPTLIRLHNR